MGFLNSIFLLWPLSHNTVIIKKKITARRKDYGSRLTACAPQESSVTLWVFTCSGDTASSSHLTDTHSKSLKEAQLYDQMIFVCFLFFPKSQRLALIELFSHLPGQTTEVPLRADVRSWTQNHPQSIFSCQRKEGPRDADKVITVWLKNPYFMHR